jgi:hypothetical protein
MTPHDERSKKAKTRKTKQKETTTMKTKLIRNIASGVLCACALVGLIAATALGTSNTARADSRMLATCGVQTLRGLYVFNAHGWNIVGGVAVPKALMTGITFNGDGTVVTPFATASINGMIFHFSGGTGSYTVNPDCTGTLSWSNGHSWDLFAEANGNKLWKIQTHDASGAGPVFEGIATRVRQ